MPDSLSTEAERPVQSKFSKGQALAGLLLVATGLLFAWWLVGLPDRRILGPHSVELRFEPVELDVDGFGSMRLIGAWRLRADDPRFGGISGLVLQGNELIALTDSGVVIRFAKPAGSRGIADIRELPGGPGDPRFKMGRDSEALVRDPVGRGWWVAFENSHQLWLFDAAFRRPLRRIRLRGHGWPANTGIEAIAAEDEALLLFPEGGGSLLRLRGAATQSLHVANAGRIADASALPSGKVMLVERRPTSLGFVNRLATMQRGANGYGIVSRSTLDVGAVDNVEALAVEELPDGRMRLWLMTDDNFQPPMRTLLVALEAPTG